MNYTPDTPQIEKTRPEYALRDTIFAYLCIPVCYLFVKSAPLSSSALGTMLTVLLAASFAICYLLLSGVRPSPTAWISCGATLVLCVGFLTNANTASRAFLSLVLMVILPIFVHTCCKNDFFASFAKAPMLRMAKALFALPIVSLVTNFLIFVPRKNGKKSRFFAIVGWCLVGLACAIIPTLIVGALLSYDEQFTNLLDRIFSFTPEKLFKNIWDVILASSLGLLFFGVLFGNLLVTQKEKEHAESPESSDKPSPLQVLPKPLLAAFVTPILLLYVLFFVSQWNYYVSAFTHVLPEGLTYAQYAREGFFQLCIVSVFNAILLVGLQAFMHRKAGERGILRRIYAGIISLFTLILIATALSKLILYINAYGMTRARILAAWMILLLAVIFVLSLIHVFWKRFPLTIAILIACVLFALILFLPNIDGMIADYNVDAYLSGELSGVDEYALYDLDYAAVPALTRLEEHLLACPSLDEESAKQLEGITEWLDFLAKKHTENPDKFFDFNIPTYRAKQMLAKRQPKGVIYE